MTKGNFQNRQPTKRPKPLEKHQGQAITAGYAPDPSTGSGQAAGDCPEGVRKPLAAYRIIGVDKQLLYF